MLIGQREGARSLTTTAAAALVSVGLVALPGSAHARPGDLDRTLSGDGFSRIDVNHTANANAATLAPDGNLYVAGGLGRSQESLALLSVRPNGRLERGFGTRGVVADDLGGDASLEAVATDRQEKIVAAGRVDDELLVVRYTSSGRLDRSFSGDGVVRLDLSEEFELASDLALQRDGRIVVAGATSQSGTRELLLIRLNPDGSFDPEFSDDGIVTGAFAGGQSSQADTVVLTSNAIVVAGTTRDPPSFEDRLGVARFLSNGQPDPEFGAGGFLALEHRSAARWSSYASDIALDRADRPLLAGFECAPGRYTVCNPLLARLGVDGHLDASFASDGWFTKAAGDYVSGVEVGPDGRILISGGAATDAGDAYDNFTVTRIRGDGHLDRGFSGDGRVTSDFRFSSDYAAGSVLQADGRLVVVGTTDDAKDIFRNDFLLARFESARGPANADADGLRDRRDLCPGGFSRHRSGCPIIERELDFRLVGRGRIRGRLDSRATPCTMGQPVRVLAVTRRADEPIARTRTDEYGAWGIPRAPASRPIYARAPRTLVRGVARCGTTRSVTLRP